MAGVGNKGRFMGEINVVPLVDVVLVLLIIFMVAAPMMVQGLEVKLPATDSGALKTSDELLMLTVTQKGQVYLDEFQVGLDGLADKLKNITSRKPGTRVYLRGGPGRALRSGGAGVGRGQEGRGGQPGHGYRAREGAAPGKEEKVLNAAVLKRLTFWEGEQVAWAVGVSLGLHLVLVAVLAFWPGWRFSRPKVFAPVYNVTLVSPGVLARPIPAAPKPAPKPAPKAAPLRPAIRAGPRRPSPSPRRRRWPCPRTSPPA